MQNVEGREEVEWKEGRIGELEVKKQRKEGRKEGCQRKGGGQEKSKGRLPSKKDICFQ
jgi:hypothetical protein